MPLNDMSLVSCILKYKCSSYFFYEINSLAHIVKYMEKNKVRKASKSDEHTLSQKKYLDTTTLSFQTHGETLLFFFPCFQ